MSARTVIVGASHAGVAAAAKLRSLSADADITLISSDAYFPYHRPVLSKAYLADKASLTDIQLRPPSWYDENGVRLLLGTRVTAVDRAAKAVSLSNGDILPYDNLVLATGAVPRRLPAAMGGELPNVYCVRDLNDANRLKSEMLEGRKLVVIGGGYIGLEAASEASKKGLSVTVLEAADRILQRVAAKETSDHIRVLHKGHGVDIREGVQVWRIAETHDRASGVELADGALIAADFIIAGIGIIPDIDLAESAGLETANGIVVDEALRSSDPTIYAIGDCASFPRNGTHLRLESVQNANDQGNVAASNIAGQTLAYNAVPWFWSDQFDLKLQIAGLNIGYDQVVVRQGANPASRAHFYFRGDLFLSADCFNDPLTFAMSRKILELAKPLAKEQAADSSFALKTLISA